MRSEDIRSALAVTFIAYAGIMMIAGGTFQVIQGFAALLGDGLFAVPPSYAFAMDATVWGWVHIVVGVLVAAAGFYLFVGKLWARLIGILAAAIGITANFAFIPYYPVWSILIIVFDLLAIWALACHGRAMAA
jgi:hypothetical protein